jgi:FAD/FMN-containing dehydrogenase
MTIDLIDELKNRLSGTLVLPQDTAYEELRKVYNGMIDKRPAMIALCHNNDDVITCVNFSRDNNVILSIRGGGHNAGGLGICDGGLVIDLSPMKDIKIDAAGKTVKVQGGCLLKELDAATHRVGMAVPAGIFGTTGIAGLTLGGGLGHLTRQWGLTIDHLLEAEVILADGTLVKASTTENPNLFWALRGGGGNFGVVVSFVFNLVPVHTVYGGPMLWHLEETEERMRWYNDFIMNAPEYINGFFVFLTVPPFDPFPAELHLKKMCGVVWCYTGDLAKAEEVFRPIRSSKSPALDFVGSLPMPALQTMFDGLYPPGLQWYWKADFVNELDDQSIALHATYAAKMPTPLSSMHMYPVNGAAARVAKDATAWNYRDSNYAVVMVGIDPDPANSEIISQWTKDYWNALHPYSAGGAYVNFMMEEGEDRIKATYGGNYERLAEIKAKYDPDNLFRVNQNIKPQIRQGTAMV